MMPDESQPSAQPQPATATQTARLTASPQPIGFETVLGTHSNIEGTLTSASNVRLDGKFSGSLDIHGNVLVGETADIHADIHAKNISIAGAVHGNVTGKKADFLGEADAPEIEDDGFAEDNAPAQDADTTLNN